MPGRALPGFPAAPQHRYRISLGTDGSVILVYTYRQRLRQQLVEDTTGDGGSWWVDVYQNDGTPIALGRRCAPGRLVVVDLAVTGAAGGVLYCAGPDTAERGDLGNGLNLVHYQRDELPVAVSSLPVGAVTL